MKAKVEFERESTMTKPQKPFPVVLVGAVIIVVCCGVTLLHGCIGDAGDGTRSSIFRPSVHAAQ